MPLSFRRSYKKHPSLDLEKNKRRAAKPEAARPARGSDEFRARKYPLAIPIGCGAFIGLCLFFAFIRGVNRLVWLPVPERTPANELATAAFETALAAQLGALELPEPTQASPATVPPAVTPTFTATATLAPAIGAPINPWAAAVPEASCIPADLPQTGRVVEVVDGDTVKVLMDGDGRVYSVRYLGIDAPDLADAFGVEATARNTDLAFRKQAILVRDLSDVDINGTLLRYVLVEKVFINYSLVAAGLAEADPAPPDTACLSALVAAEQLARASGLGIWTQVPLASPAP